MIIPKSILAIASIASDEAADKFRFDCLHISRDNEGKCRAMASDYGRSIIVAQWADIKNEPVTILLPARVAADVWKWSRKLREPRPFADIDSGSIRCGDIQMHFEPQAGKWPPTDFLNATLPPKTSINADPVLLGELLLAVGEIVDQGMRAVTIRLDNKYVRISGENKFSGFKVEAVLCQLS